MEKIKVSIVKCDSYEKDVIKPALDKCLENLNGFEDIIKQDLKILLKPNLLSPNEPEKAITTHPLFLEAIINKIISITNKPENILIADSCVPVLSYSKKGLQKLYDITGLISLSERTGVKLNYDTKTKIISVKDGIAVKQLEIIKPAYDADIIINVPKFKTHNLTIMTGAIKNMFGIIPGMAKPGYHTRFFDLDMFCNLLIDIIIAVKPTINIMDGILGMEGQGPGRGGNPRKTNMILASYDPFALDNIAANIMGLNEDNNPIMVQAKNRKIYGSNLNDIKIVGGDLRDFLILDFKLPLFNKKVENENKILKFVKNFAKNSLNPYPYFNYEKCNYCKTCYEVCPQNAIILKNNDNDVKISKNKKILSFNYNKCIRCFCCAEACPEGAIESKYNFIGNLIVNKYGKGK
jgi:uncharacterized protein (DUF362 family)/NAD-dependent dihydropyrimidine dehydrogenase PreA subunit